MEYRCAECGASVRSIDGSLDRFGRGFYCYGCQDQRQQLLDDGCYPPGVWESLTGGQVAGDLPSRQGGLRRRPGSGVASSLVPS